MIFFLLIWCFAALMTLLPIAACEMQARRGADRTIGEGRGDLLRAVRPWTTEWG